ncbi:hypothetical protein JCM19039_1852 [Geomicrobium sp. JCM 19039]|nr:hypothetical protein JCM19039_1852 [Geomicrobium sp. JCM 19039]
MRYYSWKSYTSLFLSIGMVATLVTLPYVAVICFEDFIFIAAIPLIFFFIYSSILNAILTTLVFTNKKRKKSRCFHINYEHRHMCGHCCIRSNSVKLIEHSI